MKKRNLFLAVGTISLLAPSFIVLATNNGYVEADAYKINSLPTTITLKDNADSEIRSYYSSVAGLNKDSLLIQLKKVLSNGQKYYSYDSNTAIWQMYEIIDRDWAKSPASAISGYNASTNTITGYKYGTNASHPNDPYVRALYVNREVDNKTTAWGSHQQTDQWGINQEHIWPKSHGFDTKGSDSSGGARGDPMHLWAGNGYANNIHSNDYYGYVDKTKTYKDCGNKWSTVSNNYSGTSKTMGSGTVFEPQDSDKGDIARAVFYVAARYNNIAGDDTTIDGNNPNLTLDNNINLNTGTSTATKSFSLGVLSDLLEWNKLDPVDEFEIHRNNLLYNNYTYNRNPFIDFPEWADIIWGDSTKTADPSKDTINGSSAVSLDKNELIIAPNYKSTITAVTKENTSINWTVADSTVVSLSKATSASGEAIEVTALKEGTTTIKAIEGNGEEAICTIKAHVPTTEEAIKVQSAKLDIATNNTGSTVIDVLNGTAFTATIEDGTIASVTISGNKVNVKALKVGTTKLTIKSTIYDKEYSRVIDIEVKDERGFVLDTKMIIIIAVVAVVIVIVIILILVFSKKARKKAAKYVKKQVKSTTKKSSSKTTKTSAKKKK